MDRELEGPDRIRGLPGDFVEGGRGKSRASSLKATHESCDAFHLVLFGSPSGYIVATASETLNSNRTYRSRGLCPSALACSKAIAIDSASSSSTARPLIRNSPSPPLLSSTVACIAYLESRCRSWRFG